MNMTLSASDERSAVNARAASLSDQEKEEEENHQRSGPSASLGVTIPYPCCPREKVVVFPGAHGCASIKCPNCGKYSLFNYDTLTSEPGEVCRGATKRSREKKNPGKK